MNSRLLIVAVVTGGLLVVARPIFAHHAQSYYDRDQQVTFSGTVTEYAFANPHVQIHFDVKDENGTVTSWTAESGPPQRMYRVGWTKNSLKPGDQVTVTGAPAKDGRHMVSIQKLVAPEGKELTLGAE